MSVGQEHDSGADDPDLIRLNKRSLFTPSASVAVEQHSAVPHVSRSTYGTAKVEGRLTSPNARVPEIITQRCGGITVKGHTLKSFAYTTDAVIIRNTNANAILAVYPFTGEPVITQRCSPWRRCRCSSAWVEAPPPVRVWQSWPWWRRCRRGRRDHQRAGTGGNHRNDHVDGGHPRHRHGHGDDEITECKILAGAAIINVAAGARTAQVVASIRAHHPEIPILASGGGREDRILATIDAGADAITWTPPSAQQLQSQMMAKYRGEV